MCVCVCVYIHVPHHPLHTQAYLPETVILQQIHK